MMAYNGVFKKKMRVASYPILSRNYRTTLIKMAPVFTSAVFQYLLTVYKRMHTSDETLYSLFAIPAREVQPSFC